MRALFRAALGLLIVAISCSSFAAAFDIVLRGGTVYDGSGKASYIADIGINNDKIAVIDKYATTNKDVDPRPPSTSSLDGKVEIDVHGLAVAPGFINMLSWSTESLLIDGASQGDIRQGVTLEVFGEGSSMGPVSPAMRQQMLDQQGDYRFDVSWNTLGEYLEHLQTRGIGPNVASFIGATTVRVHELGFSDRAPSASELKRMQALVAQAMEEGALGVGSSLIYAPAFYAKTDELVALMKTAAAYGGTYISHMRSEGNRLLESIDELIHIAEQSGAPAEIYHLKVSGRENWHKYDAVVDKIENARSRGIKITANMYTYTAGSTGLDAAMPPWVQEGGYQAWVARLQDPDIRQRVLAEMSTPTNAWENLYLAAGADKTLLVGFRNPDLRAYAGMTLAEVATLRDKTPAETAIDLVIEDGSRVQVVYFLMSEENVRKTVALPWVSFGSDARSMTTNGIFIKTSTHPRAYGNFARVLGKYTRDEGVLSLPNAIYKLTKLPAQNLNINNRGELAPGFYADIAIFDPQQIRDHATYKDPHRYSTGMVHVFVNGQQVLRDGEHTGLLPGRVVRGPGWLGWQKP